MKRDRRQDPAAAHDGEGVDSAGNIFEDDERDPSWPGDIVHTVDYVTTAGGTILVSA